MWVKALIRYGNWSRYAVSQQPRISKRVLVLRSRQCQLTWDRLHLRRSSCTIWIWWRSRHYSIWITKRVWVGGWYPHHLLLLVLLQQHSLVLLHHGHLHVGWWCKTVWCQEWIHMLDRWHSWTSLEWARCDSIHAHVVAVWGYTIGTPPLQCIII